MLVHINSLSSYTVIHCPEVSPNTQQSSCSLLMYIEFNESKASLKPVMTRDSSVSLFLPVFKLVGQNDKLSGLKTH